MASVNFGMLADRRIPREQVKRRELGQFMRERRFTPRIVSRARQTGWLPEIFHNLRQRDCETLENKRNIYWILQLGYVRYPPAAWLDVAECNIVRLPDYKTLRALFPW